MAVNIYGTNDPMAKQQKPLRGILEDLGFSNYDVGYNSKNKNAMLMGQEFDSKQFTPGSDNHYYTTENEVQRQLKTLGISPQKYQSQYGTQIKDIVGQLQNRKFDYNPNKDRALRQAQGQAQRSVQESMNERGILSSTVTADRAAQATAQLEPQYEQMARDAFNQETSQMMNNAQLLQGLDDRDYAQFKDKLDKEYQTRVYNYQTQQDQIQQERAKIGDAWQRVQQLGYVDNQSSVALGLPVGTQSAEVAKEIRQRQSELDMFNKQLEAQKSQDERNFQQQVQIIGIENANRERASATEFSRQKELMQMKPQSSGLQTTEDVLNTALRMRTTRDDIGEQMYSDKQVVDMVVNSGLPEERIVQVLNQLGVDLKSIK